MINTLLKWDDHTDAITTKAAMTLSFLKTLERARVTVDDLAHYYQTVVRPVLEYACPVYLLSCAKSHMLSASRRQPHLLHVSAVDRHQTWSMDKS